MTKLKEMRKKPITGLIVIAMAVFIDMLLYSIVVPIVPFYTSKFDASQTVIGILIGCYAFSFLIATPILGGISDKFGRRGVMLWGLVVLLASTLLFAFANSMLLLIVARLLQGVAAAATWTAGLALITDMYPPAKRGKALGAVLFLVGAAAGFVLTPTLPELANSVDRLGGGAYATAFAVFNMAYSVGMIIGPIVGGGLADLFGISTALYIMCFVLVGYSLSSRLVKHERKATYVNNKME